MRIKMIIPLLFFGLISFGLSAQQSPTVKGAIFETGKLPVTATKKISKESTSKKELSKRFKGVQFNVSQKVAQRNSSTLVATKVDGKNLQETAKTLGNGALKPNSVFSKARKLNQTLIKQ